jgi:hypothetical protein
LVRFERIIAPKKVVFPPIPNVFALDDAAEMEDIMAEVAAIFGAHAI